MFRKLPFIVLVLHAYVGWRLLPDMLPSAIGFGATALWLLVSVIATPLWPVARQITRQPLKDRLTLASMLAIGSFSSLFVLTFIRDLTLILSTVAGATSLESALRTQGAFAVPILAAVATIVGFVNARRRCMVSALRKSAISMSARRSSASTWSGSSTP
jgi:uncharacterized protein